MQQHLPSLALDVFRLCIWLVLLAIVFIPLERLCAQHQQPIFRKGLMTDLGYYFLNSIVPKFLLIVPMSIVAWSIHHYLPSGMYASVAALPVRVRFVLAIVVGEFGAYWGHRWSHEIPLLWRFHAVHHSAQEMDWLVNTRAHPLDMFFTRCCGLLPIYLLGLAQPMGTTVDLVPLVYAIVGTVWSFFVHANLSWRFGLLEQVVATPAFHHWHHTNDGAEYINKNYAAILPLMDILFGTIYLPTQRWPKQYGIEEQIAPDFGGQLLQPFAGKLTKFKN
ncbi:sterol desaturase family protein [Chamaesiphon sp.]|uniref:sterol desaturase family protein n=1 Tax=Chamaesiphon sp. TaxID=2814140 RepID=UPI00359470F0